VVAKRLRKTTVNPETNKGHLNGRALERRIAFIFLSFINFIIVILFIYSLTSLSVAETI
jgi:hypothetical protein